MARFFKERKVTMGAAPGSLILVGRQKMDKPVFQLIQYDSEILEEEECASIDKAIERIKEDRITWINIYGIHDIEMIQKIGNALNLPALHLEEILNTDQRPKFQESENYNSFILKYLYNHPESDEIRSDQISIIFGENFVLTLQERKAGFLEPVRQRLRNNKTPIRKRGSDYLTYAILDTLVDTYSELLESVGSRTEEMEDKIFEKTDASIAEEIYRIKTDINFLRKSIRPVNEIITRILKSDDTLFTDITLVFMQNLNDLIKHVTESVELYNGMASDQLNVYNTNVSNSMNAVMKVLTIFASIFIPLTFLAGIYGMNFEFIPELGFKYGYLGFWIVTIVVGISLVIYFKRQKWL